MAVFALSVCAVLMNAPRASAGDPDVTGKWHFVLDTPGGDRESDAEFLVDGGKVTGKYGKADVAGTFKEGKIDLAFTIDTEEAGSGTLKIVGAIDGDAITGNWEFTEYNGTFKATRTPAAPPPTPPTPAAPGSPRGLAAYVP
jgi:hypothetical protein